MPLITQHNRDPQPIHIKIISDGAPGGLVVVDTDTGARVWGVESVIIQARAGEAPSAIIRVANVEVEMRATVDAVIGTGSAIDGE